MWRTLLYVRFASSDPTNRHYDRYDGSGSCVDGSLLARVDLTFVQIGRVQSCVRPVDAARMTAGPNAIRRIGSQSKPRA